MSNDKVTFVTTFSVDGYHCYGQGLVDSMMEHGDPHELVVYHESQPNVDYHKRLTWRNLDHDTDRQKFIEDHGTDPDKVGSASDPNSQAIRFCHKVFAITDAIRRADTDWVIWIDADVIIHSKILPSHINQICGDSLVSYLGRVDAPYTECGFVAYRASSNIVQSMADDMRHYYTSGEIFYRDRSDWHDSRCFDICLGRSSVPDSKKRNLSRGARGWHVWPATVLNDFSKHQKGPRRKYMTYGSIVE